MGIFQPYFRGDDKHVVKLLFPGLEGVDVPLQQDPATAVPVVLELPEPLPPELHHEVRGKFLSNSMSVSALHDDGADHVVLEEVHLQVVKPGEVRRARTPSTSS